MGSCNKCSSTKYSSNYVNIDKSTVGMKYNDKQSFLMFRENGFTIEKSIMLLYTLFKEDFFVSIDSYSTNEVIIPYKEKVKIPISPQTDLVIMFPRYDINREPEQMFVNWRYYSSILDNVNDINPDKSLDDFMTFGDLIKVMGGDTSLIPNNIMDLNDNFSYEILNEIFEAVDLSYYLVYSSDIDMSEKVTFKGFKAIFTGKYQGQLKPKKDKKQNNKPADSGIFVPHPKGCGDCEEETEPIILPEFSQYLNFSEYNKLHKLYVSDIPVGFFEGIEFHNLFYKSDLQVSLLTLNKS